METVVSLVIFLLGFSTMVLGAEMGSFNYDDFRQPTLCKACHGEIYQEWDKGMMSDAFTHQWDEIEYFKLALPHALKEPKVAGVKGGCIACHGPLAFLAGDIPPKRPADRTRANEAVSCEICHTITGSTEEEPYNFSYIIAPKGNVKQGVRKDSKSPFHKTSYSEFLRSPRHCATCHDEASPFGAWVKSTYREWKEGPYSKKGIVCQDCHMHRAPGKSAVGGKDRPDVAHHVFQGAHNPSKLAGAVDIALYAGKEKVSPGDEVVIKAVLFNGKAGHKIPTGSAEERQLWLHVEAVDVNGKSYHLPVDIKGFPGEEYTITSHRLVYQDIGEIMDVPDFKGLSMDGDDVPEGDRAFRMPFFDPKGRMTIAQWNTARNDLVDYRIGPQETKIETYTWKIPKDAKFPVKVVATLNYRLLPSSVARFLGVPEEEIRIFKVNENVLELLK